MRAKNDEYSIIGLIPLGVTQQSKFCDRGSTVCSGRSQKGGVYMSVGERE